MTVTLDLPADMEKVIRERADQDGQDVGHWLLNLARREVMPADIPRLSDEEFERILDELADAVGPEVPDWTNEDLSREVIYGERG